MAEDNIRQLDERINRLMEQERRNHSSGDPPKDGMESRVAKLEAVTEAMDKRLSLIETDIRDIGKKLDTHFYITWAGIIGLAALMAKGFKWF